MSGVATPGQVQAKMARSAISRFFAADNRYLPPIFITLILLVSQLSFGLLESLSRTVLAIAVSMGCEIVLGLLMYRKIPNLASAYITGISVGILLRSPAFWPYALCSVLSILLLFVLCVKGRHFWNPSNFGICVLLFFAPETVAAVTIQWGNFIWPLLVIWILGSV